MKTGTIRNVILLSCIIGFSIHFSCTKEEVIPDPPRIFRPVPQFDNTIEGTLIIYFKSIEGAEYYDGDISQDSAFVEIDQSVRIMPDTATIYYGDTKYTYIRFNNLLPAQDYFIRVKAIHADSSMNSEYYELKASTLNLFVDPTSSEILDVAFKCKWDIRGAILNKITVKVVETDSIVGDYWVLDSENRSGVKIIDGLKGNTSYAIYLYSGSLLRGKGFVTTKAPIEGNIVDLRFMESNTALWDTIHKVESGVIILLKRGQSYIFPSARQITGSVTVMSGYDFATELAEIRLQGNPFSTPLNSFIDEIIFRDVNVTSTYESDSYFFFLEELANISKVKFENVRSHGHRGFFRVGPDVVVDSLILENCIIDSLREYGITHISGTNASINNILTKNCTFYGIVRPHFNTSAAVNPSNKIVHENVTFYNTPDVGRYFFDYSTGTDVTFRNCIFGQTKTIFNQGDTIDGFKPEILTISSQGSYYTNDFISPNYPGLIPYPNSSYDLFEDPDNHNFKIRDIGFSGANTAGDPRWW